MANTPKSNIWVLIETRKVTLVAGHSMTESQASAQVFGESFLKEVYISEDVTTRSAEPVFLKFDE